MGAPVRARVDVRVRARSLHPSLHLDVASVASLAQTVQPKRPIVFRGMARLTPSEIGQIKAHLHRGLGPSAIACIVKKAVGANAPVQGVSDAKAELEENPAWPCMPFSGSWVAAGGPRERGPWLKMPVGRPGCSTGPDDGSLAET